MKNPHALLLLLLASAFAFPQQAPNPKAPASKPPAQPATPPAAKGEAQASARKAPDPAEAYYHYMRGHTYEEMRDFNKAIEEYRLAIEADPSSEFLTTELAELYVNAGRIRDAVLEAQEVLKRDPRNVGAHKLLGRIYLRSLGDMQAGSQSQNLLRLAIEQYEEIVRLEPSLENHLLLGRLYKVNGDLGKAESEFKTAIGMQPASEDAVTTLAYLYNEQGDYQKAVETLNTVPEAARTAKTYAALGFVYEQQKDSKQAIAAYRKAMELDRDNLDSVRGLAQNLLNDGQMDAALEQYKALADADPQDAQTQLRIAEIYRRMGQFDLALASLNQAEALEKDSLEIPYNIALVYESQGRFQDAVDKLQVLLGKTTKTDGSYSSGERTNRTIFLERLGNVYREMNQEQLALETFRKMLELGDENASRGYQEMVDTYRDLRQWNQAAATAREAVAKLPQDRGLKLVLAAQLADTGQEEEALTQLKAMLKGTPEDREAYLTLAQVNSRLRRWKDAEEAIGKAESLSARPEEKDAVNFIKGSIYERQKKYDLAEEMFKTVLAADPRSAPALNYLGYMLADRGLRLDEALRYIQKAVQLDPQDGAYLDSLGWVYFKLGNYDLAEANLRKASERIGNDGTIQDHLAELYQKTGRLKQAITHWERALQEWSKALPADVDSADVARVQKKLESTKVRLAQQTGTQQKQ